LVVLTAFAIAFAAGCGGGDDASATEEAQQTVCDDASSLEQAVETLVDDVTSLDFGSAKDQLTEVAAAAAKLAGAVQALGADKKSEIKGQVDALESTIGDLTSASSIDEIGSTLDAAQSQLQGVLDTVTSTLSCS
jgi:hypothetical protein